MSGTESVMYYISGMSTYAQMQYWRTRQDNMQQYLNTSQALMASVTSSMSSLYEGQATLTERQALSRIASGNSNGSISVLVAQLANANAQNGLVSMLNGTSSTSSSSVNLLA
jgi:hypothetical protein